ncbi:PaeR7I family type II restriction endonuclease [Streptomyces sp. NPDC056653]|uniref:PaeR7I family type II restriction endonuclease n=1 Tax=Streptomyces sp. NPDC056653 TaxID=3345894 RepID=UPI0036A35570
MTDALTDAVRKFWIDSNKRTQDQLKRRAFGQNMDPIINATVRALIDRGIDPSWIRTGRDARLPRSLGLRHSLWDIVVTKDDTPLGSIEFKALLGLWAAHNLQNRIDELTSVPARRNRPGPRARAAGALDGTPDRERRRAGHPSAWRTVTRWCATHTGLLDVRVRIHAGKDAALHVARHLRTDGPRADLDVALTPERAAHSLRDACGPARPGHRHVGQHRHKACDGSDRDTVLQLRVASAPELS